MTLFANEKNKMGYGGLGLPIIFFSGLVLPYFIPTALSMLIKPIGIFLIIIYLRTVGFKIKVKSQQVLLVLYMVVFAFAVVRSNYDGLVPAIGYGIYILFSLVCISISFSQKGVERLLKACFWAGAVFSLSVAISNPFFGTTMYKRTNLFLFGDEINVNQIVYVVVIGLSVLPRLLIKEEKIDKNWKMYVPLIIIMMYVVLLTLSRGGFLCLVGILGLVVWKLMKKTIKKNPIKTFLIGLIICAIIVSIMSFMPSAQMNRLFSVSAYEDSTGRFEMFSSAISNVENVVFGNGYGVWGETGKIHNLFINTYANCGLLGFSVIIFLVVNLMIKINDEKIWCIFLPMIIQAMVESGDSYTFWIPYILVNILVAERKSLISKAQ